MEFQSISKEKTFWMNFIRSNRILLSTPGSGFFRESDLDLVNLHPNPQLCFEALLDRNYFGRSRQNCHYSQQDVYKMSGLSTGLKKISFQLSNNKEYNIYLEKIG